MPITCPDGKEARYRFSKRKLSGGKRARLAFCGNTAVEVTIFKGKKKIKTKKLKGWFGNSIGHSIAAKKRRTKLLKGFVKEEKQTAKLYKKLGYPKQGKDEAGHARFFEKEAERFWYSPFSPNDPDIKSMMGEYVSLRRLGYPKKRAIEKVVGKEEAKKYLKG
jgi:hypothetical protein